MALKMAWLVSLDANKLIKAHESKSVVPVKIKLSLAAQGILVLVPIAA